MPTEDADQDTDQPEKNREASTSSAPEDRKGQVDSGVSRTRPDSNDQHPAQSAMPCNTKKAPDNKPKSKPTQQPTQPSKPEKAPAKTDPKTPTTPRPVILLPEPTPPETLQLAAARNNPDQPTRQEFLRDAQPHTPAPKPPQPSSNKKPPPTASHKQSPPT